MMINSEFTSVTKQRIDINTIFQTVLGNVSKSSGLNLYHQTGYNDWRHSWYFSGTSAKSHDVFLSV